jgi:cobyrinic acid a,c-diamide synthase
MTRALMIAAPRSGSGKTTITLALAAALRRRGIAVRCAKSGPDYIDPAHHEAATGRPSLNLDSWAMPPALLENTLARAAEGAELLLIESAMGLFDGLDAPPGARGAAADLAARFTIPVLLVLDVSGQSQSAAAVARGFASHDPAVRIAGVVLNRFGSERHRAQVEAALQALPLAVLGAFPRDPTAALPERHLGLVQAEELDNTPARLAHLADQAERWCDLDGILAAGVRWAAAQPTLQASRRVGCAATHQTTHQLPPPGQRIALARDPAFSFVYPHLLAAWRDAGAEIIPFSPLADEPPPEDCDAAWLPGGYPELHAGRLAEAERFRAGLVRFAETRPVHGECGGFMVLGAMLEDAEGVAHPMSGLLGHATSFARRRLSLGYRRAALLADGPLGRAGTVLRGHEFHYATVLDPGPDAAFAAIEDGAGHALGLAGGRRGHVSGSFFHVIATEGP